MRNAIREYIEYSDAEKETLWTTATIVFDTNVFLNMYRYSNNTRNQLLDSIERFKNRVWMPYQVAMEFCKDRYGVINEANSRFDNMSEEGIKLVDSWRKELRIDDNDFDAKNLSDYLNDWITKKKEKNYLVFDPGNDEVFQRVLDLFDGKVGCGFSSQEKQAIQQDGEKRYEHKVPPGYKDHNKKDNQYGDLFVWKEILQYAKTQGVDIIFVTHDRKEDWWNINGGKTIGPRIELRKEFYEETGHKFHMYTMTSFLTLCTDNKGKSIDKTTIDEVELFSSVMRHKVSRAELRAYYASLDDMKERTAAKLRFEIARLERKNKKRRSNIHMAIAKAKEQSLSADEEVAFQRNKERLEADEEKIAKCNEKLDAIYRYND